MPPRRCFEDMNGNIRSTAAIALVANAQVFKCWLEPSMEWHPHCLNWTELKRSEPRADPFFLGVRCSVKSHGKKAVSGDRVSSPSLAIQDYTSHHLRLWVQLCWPWFLAHFLSKRGRSAMIDAVANAWSAVMPGLQPGVAAIYLDEWLQGKMLEKKLKNSSYQICQLGTVGQKSVREQHIPH